MYVKLVFKSFVVVSIILIFITLIIYYLKSLDIYNGNSNYKIEEVLYLYNRNDLKLVLNKSFIANIPALLCLGTEKGGTTSLSRSLKDIPELWSWNHTEEMHYFDGRCYTRHNRYFFKSFNISINNFYNKSCSIKKFKLLFQNKYKKETFSELNNSIYIYEKTPINMLFPHIAQLCVNGLAADGTKFFIVLRDPIKRFISGYFEQFGYNIRNEKNGLFNYLRDNICGNFLSLNQCMTDKLDYDTVNNSNNLIIKTKQFNNYMKHSLHLYKQNDNILKQSDIIYSIGFEYSDFFYWIMDYIGFEKVKLIWLRGCYAPQIIFWLYLLDKLNLKNSLKIIQSELLFNKNTFQQNLMYLRCYMHSNEYPDYAYNDWIKSCINQNTSSYHMIFNRYHLQQKTHSFNATVIETINIKNSYKICNKWLKVLIDEKYSNLIDLQWDWNLWNI